MASPTCTSLLFSHVGLFSIAIGSLFMTIIILSWFFYKTVKHFTKPTIKEIKDEIGFNNGIADNSNKTVI